MPRKVNYGLDYDTEDGVYDDYDHEEYEDYQHDIDIEGYDEISNVELPPPKPGIWHCPICTFDNDDKLSACDICGVLRNPLPVKETFDMSKDSGVSMLGKSLFSQVPRKIMQNDESTTYETSNLNRVAKIQGNCTSFNFDHLPEDDLVSSGKRSAVKVSEANFDELSSARASSSITRKKEKDKTPRSNNIKESNSAKVPEVGKPSMLKNSTSVNEGKLQNLTDGFNNVTVGADLGYTQKPTSTSKASYKQETWMIPAQEGTLTQLNLAIVGHVDSGKSTLSGRLLSLLGRISAKEMHKYERDAKIQGKGSFAYAWALDESAEERERGITMTVAVAYFDSTKYHVVLLDSPGHKDFIPNMISGATQADAAVLVVDASKGSFEAGIDANGGQTREHAQLIRSFGVDQVIVAINKMDAVEYSKDRFDSIKSQLGKFLHSCGFKESFLSWVPVSAMENQNLVAAASDVRLKSWYRGPYFLEAVDSFQPPVRDISKPLRMPICDSIKSHSLGQVAASGKLESGALKSGLKVLVFPSGELATVRSIERDSQACTIARAGDNVAVSLQGIDGNRVMTGGVLCHPEFPVSVATHLELKVLILDVVMPILVGSQVEFHVHHAKEAARVAKILSLLDQKTGNVSKRAPRCLISKQSALIEVILEGAVCVEEFSDCRALGRVFLRASGRTIGVGIITRIIQ